MTLAPRVVGKWKQCPSCGGSDPLYTGKIRYTDKISRFWTIVCGDCLLAREVQTYKAEQLDHIDPHDLRLVKWPKAVAG